MTQSLVAVRDRRELVIAQLSEAYANDLLDVDELERRLDLAHSVSTVAELDALVTDLELPKSTALVAVGSHAIDDPQRPQAKQLRVVLGSVERRNRWTVPRNLKVSVTWGHVELDFRDASIGPGVTEIEIRVVMANLEIVLPPWLAIDIDTSSFASSVEERHRVPTDPDESRPILRITGSVWFGSVEIATRLPGETARDARKRERRDRKQRRLRDPNARRGRRRRWRDERRALPPSSGEM